MSRIFLFVYALFVCLPLSAQSVWTRRAGGASTDLANSLWVDAAKNVFVTGSISGQAKFHKTEISSRGGGDIYVAKYNPAGVPLWVKTFGGKLDDFANAITGDPEGNLYLTGIFTDTAYFEGQPLEAKGTDLFVLKLNPRGQLQWVKRLETNGTAIAQCIAVTDQGGVYVGGLFSGQYNKKIARQMGQTDGFVAKLSWQGELSWTKIMGGAGFDEVNMLSTDPWGRVLAAGVFDNAMYVEDTEIRGYSSKSAFAIRMEATGNVLWSRGLSGSDAQSQIADATTDLAGNVYLTGKFSGETQFGDQVMVSKGQTDVFVCSINSKGQFNWASSMGGSEVDDALSIQISPNEKFLLVSGSYNKFLENGKKSIQAEYDNQIFMSRWDTRGNLDDLRKEDLNSVFHCAGKKLDAAGNLWLCGSFSEKTSFGKTNFVSAGEEDLFITALYDPKVAR